MNTPHEAGGEERVETPADRARKDGTEELSLHRWTDAELRQLARDRGLELLDPLTRAELIEILEAAE